MTRYFLNELGIVNALGADKQTVLTNLLGGTAPGMRASADYIAQREVMIGAVDAELPRWPHHLAQFDCRNNRMLLAAYLQIREATEAAIATYGAERVGIVIGSSTSGIREGEAGFADWQTHAEFPPHYHYRQQEIGAPALALAAYLQLPGIAYTVSTACSSSAKALASARNLLALGLCDAVLVGGVDSLCKLTLNGFHALESIAAGRCNPFSAARDGINIGEGAALFLMTTQPGAIELCGIGECSDAHHISAPHPQGEGAETAMRAALLDADLSPAATSYINLHGTATPKNDELESRAVARGFGAAVACSSTKPLTGHTLGAAGSSEVGLCWLLLSTMNAGGALPAQVWDDEFDAALPAIDLLKEQRSLPCGMPRYFLSNSFAFGGSNCAVIVGSA